MYLPAKKEGCHVERYTVACVQQRLRLFLTLDEYEDSVRRFLRAAQNKQARLVIFPELGGLTLIPPLLSDFRSSLLKRADLGRRRSASIWQKLVGSLANGAAGMVKADFRTGMAGLLDVASASLWERYTEIFGSLAREFHLTLIAPGAYLPDPLDGVIRNLTVVFAPDGTLLGTQAKVMLSQEDEQFCQPGSSWNVIHSEIGALGVMVGNDVLFPEVGRLLSFQGAETLVVVATSNHQAQYNKLRAGALARMQDNQLFAACSFLIGANMFSAKQNAPLIGKSAIFAPQELTPRFNGVLVEMGTVNSEGILTAEWDFAELRALWEKSELRTRDQLNASQASQLLTAIYRQLQAMPRIEAHDAMEESGDAGATIAQAHKALTISLDDLPVIASVTSRWPPHSALHVDAPPTEETVLWTAPDLLDAAAADSQVRYEDETDEMDALDDRERTSRSEH
jgi:predicted amidohydrolase